MYFSFSLGPYFCYGCSLRRTCHICQHLASTDDFATALDTEGCRSSVSGLVSVWTNHVCTLCPWSELLVLGALSGKVTCSIAVDSTWIVRRLQRLIASVEATAIDNQKLLINMQQLYDHEAFDAYLKTRSRTLSDCGMPVTVVMLYPEWNGQELVDARHCLVDESVCELMFANDALDTPCRRRP